MTINTNPQLALLKLNLNWLLKCSYQHKPVSRKMTSDVAAYCHRSLPSQVTQQQGNSQEKKPCSM